jgi:hypothetical protein
MFYFECFNGSFNKTPHHHRWQGTGYTLGETIHFGSLDFIIDCFNSLSLSTKGNDLNAVFMGWLIVGRLHYILFLRNPLTRATHPLAEGEALASPSHEDATW